MIELVLKFKNAGELSKMLESFRELSRLCRTFGGDISRAKTRLANLDSAKIKSMRSALYWASEFLEIFDKASSPAAADTAPPRPSPEAPGS